jgi:hypothetical protein
MGSYSWGFGLILEVYINIFIHINPLLGMILKYYQHG